MDETRAGRRAAILLAGILIGAAFVRLWGLDWGLPTKTLSLTTYHPDEAYMFQSFENMARTRSLHPGRIGLLYGTLYFYLSAFLIGLAKFAGWIQIGSRDFLLQNLPNLDRMYLIVRFFSALCGVLAVGAVYLLGRRLLGREGGLWAALFLAFFPAAIAVSHYAKVDSLLVFLVTIQLWLSLDLLEAPTTRKALQCGLIAGFLASTKYNAGIFVLTPLFAIMFSPAQNKQRLIIMITFSSLAGFLTATPYAALDFPLFGSCLMEQFGMLGGSGLWEAGHRNGFWRYLSYYIPFGVGWIPWILGLIGIILILSGGFSKLVADFPYIRKERKLHWLLLLTSFLIIFGLLGKAGHRLTALSAPLLPFLAIFAAAAVGWIGSQLSSLFKTSFWGMVVLTHLAYGMSFARLYVGPDPRESAGTWLQAHVPKETPVGLIRSYFWTPGILRQARPPFPIVAASDEKIAFHSSSLGLRTLDPLPPYFVVSEMETVEYFRTENIEPIYAQALRDFFSRYELAQSFELKPRLGPFEFWRRLSPWDFRMISPSTFVYRKRN